MAEWLAGQHITAARLNSAQGVWQDYGGAWTASTTNPSIGNGSATYRYMQVGSTVEFLIRIVFGSSTSSGSGTYDFGLPVAPKDHGGGRTISGVAPAIIEISEDGGDFSGFRYSMNAFLFATGLVRVADDGDTSGIGSGGMPGAAWRDGDFIIISGRYEVD